MAIKETVKGHCGESKCTYDVYTKEKVDELLNEKVSSDNVYVKDNYAVLEGIATVKAHTVGQTTTFDYPEGFTQDNTAVLSKLLGDAEGEELYFSTSENITVWTNPNDIEVSVSDNRENNEYDYNWKYKVVLMKYKD